jgi:hypothetical protein
VPYCQKVRAPLHILVFGFVLAAALCAGCRGESRSEPTEPDGPTSTVTVIYEIAVGNGYQSWTCIEDERGRRCTPGYVVP